LDRAEKNTGEKRNEIPLSLPLIEKDPGASSLPKGEAPEGKERNNQIIRRYKQISNFKIQAREKLKV
jgi:hypothetical protein